MEEKFTVRKLTERTISLTLRLDSELNRQLEELASKSNRSRNELINMSIKFALERCEFIDNEAK